MINGAIFVHVVPRYPAIKADLALSNTAFGGLGFVALQAVQTLGRFGGDAAVTRWGDRAVARAGATLVVVALPLARALPVRPRT